MSQNGDRFIFLTEMGFDPSERVFVSRSDKSVLGRGQGSNRPLNVCEGSILVAKAGLGPGQLVQELGIVRLSAQKLAHHPVCFLISRGCFGSVTGMSLQIAERIFETSQRIA